MIFSNDVSAFVHIIRHVLITLYLLCCSDSLFLFQCNGHGNNSGSNGSGCMWNDLCVKARDYCSRFTTFNKGGMYTWTHFLTNEILRKCVCKSLA